MRISFYIVLSLFRYHMHKCVSNMRKFGLKHHLILMHIFFALQILNWSTPTNSSWILNDSLTATCLHVMTNKDEEMSFCVLSFHHPHAHTAYVSTPTSSYNIKDYILYIFKLHTLSSRINDHASMCESQYQVKYHIKYILSMATLKCRDHGIVQPHKYFHWFSSSLDEI